MKGLISGRGVKVKGDEDKYQASKDYHTKKTVIMVCFDGYLPLC